MDNLTFYEIVQMCLLVGISSETPKPQKFTEIYVLSASSKRPSWIPKYKSIIWISCHFFNEHRPLRSEGLNVSSLVGV